MASSSSYTSCSSSSSAPKYYESTFREFLLKQVSKRNNVACLQDHNKVFHLFSDVVIKIIDNQRMGNSSYNQHSFVREYPELRERFEFLSSNLVHQNFDQGMGILSEFTECLMVHPRFMLDLEYVHEQIKKSTVSESSSSCASSTSSSSTTMLEAYSSFNFADIMGEMILSGEPLGDNNYPIIQKSLKLILEADHIVHQSFSSDFPEAMELFDITLFHFQRRNIQAYGNALSDLIERLKHLPKFKLLMENANHLVNTKEEVITVENIRETFYNVMLDVSSEPELFDIEDLAAQESFVFIALPSITLLRVMWLSKELVDVVQLCGNKRLSMENCPASHQGFAAILIPLKKEVGRLTEEQFKILEQFCLENPDKPVENSLITPEISSIKAKLQSVGIQVSQMKTFKGIIPEILKIYS